MSKSFPALHSTYVIDGVTQEHTPAQLLDAVTDGAPEFPMDCPDTVVDETLDPVVSSYEFDSNMLDSYLAGLSNVRKILPLAFTESYSCGRVAEALIDAIWLNGRFRIGDLRLKASWKWNEEPVGSRAAFYNSVKASADYLDGMGLKFSSYSYARSSECDLSFKATLAKDDGVEDAFVGQPFRSEHPVLGSRRACPVSLVPDPQSWIVFVPFETCDFRLGGSLLAQTLGFGGGVPPQVGDADYFLDCYEVIREFVEDGLLLSGNTVRVGGLLKSLKDMAADGTGATVDISNILKAYQEKDIIRVLFSEIPGVIIQIRDIDFDYLDAELLLQDVAFFPLGHPVAGSSEVRVKASAKTGIQTILESLMLNAEGED